MATLPTLLLRDRYLACFYDRRVRIEKRLAAIPAEIKRASKDQEAELVTEERNLTVLLQRTIEHINQLTVRPVRDEDREKRIQILLREKEEAHRHSQERWIKRGDHRQARMFREMAMDLRFEAEMELGGGILR